MPPGAQMCGADALTARVGQDVRHEALPEALGRPVAMGLQGIPEYSEHCDGQQGLGVKFDARYNMPVWQGAGEGEGGARQGTPPVAASSSARQCVGSLTVVPRRKAWQKTADMAAPVNITLETLRTFADVPLSKAATHLGISPTAMKKACRKLGVTRWPYKSTSAPPPETVPMANPARF